MYSSNDKTLKQAEEYCDKNEIRDFDDGFTFSHNERTKAVQAFIAGAEKLTHLQKKIYTVTMRRNGEAESHHYIIGAFTDLATAYIHGIENANFRADKYVPFIQEMTIDSDGSVLEVTQSTAFDFAKLKLPHRFNDLGELLEEENQLQEEIIKDNNSEVKDGFCKKHPKIKMEAGDCSRCDGDGYTNADLEDMDDTTSWHNDGTCRQCKGSGIGFLGIK